MSIREPAGNLMETFKLGAAILPLQRSNASRGRRAPPTWQGVIAGGVLTMSEKKGRLIS